MTGTSEDVIHDFGVPAFRSKIDVVPGRYTTTWYHPTKLGEYHIFCDQYCGHLALADGRQGVRCWSEGRSSTTGSWGRRSRTTTPKNSVDGSPAWEGNKLFLKLQCINCHNADAEAAAPRARRALQPPACRSRAAACRRLDDAEYLGSRSAPMAKVVDGWKPIMPAYAAAR